MTLDLYSVIVTDYFVHVRLHEMILKYAFCCCFFHVQLVAICCYNAFKVDRHLSD
jgi:hypothetical protein